MGRTTVVPTWARPCVYLGWRLWPDTGKKYVLVKTGANPSADPYYMLNEQTGWPTIPGKFSWVKSSGGLGRPTVPVLEKTGVASPPLIGSTYPSAYQQAPSTMASLYGRGAQCWWVIPTHCPGQSICSMTGENPARSSCKIHSSVGPASCTFCAWWGQWWGKHNSPWSCHQGFLQRRRVNYVWHSW